MATKDQSPGERRAAVRERHQEAAADVVPEDPRLYVGGEWVDAERDETFNTVDPTSGEVLASVPRGREADVDAAVRAACDAFESGWADATKGDRQEILDGVADAILDAADELATLETLDNGKPIREATGDIYNSAEQFRYFAGIVRTNRGETTVDDGRFGQVVREPYGVVGQIIPWNFPLLTAAWKLAPALAAGNCTVLKPAEQTPLSAIRLLELVEDIVPDGVVNVVTGYGPETGEPLSRHEGVRKVAFTGSTTVGKEVMRNAATNVADVTLELGGKSPVVVFPDADIDRAVRTVSAAILANSGECCEAGSRLFVHEDVADDLLDGLVAAAESMTIGDPLLEDTDLGPKISDAQVDRTLEYLQSTRDADATFLTGGGRPDDDGLSDGCFVSPAIITDLDHDHQAVQEEIFGPVLEVFHWSDYDRMIDLANDVKYGLAAGVLTEDVNRANQAAMDIEAGYVWINTYHELVPGLPFGGYKQSGIGRELGAETLDQYSRTKTINLSLR
jgi:aldehyde dehydrogenase (NAD+)